jgi:hypothetical protein
VTEAGRVLNRYITAFVFVVVGAAGLMNQGQPWRSPRNGHVFDGRSIWFFGLFMFLTGIVICATAVKMHLEHREREKKGEAYQRWYSRRRGNRRQASPASEEDEE